MRSPVPLLGFDLTARGRPLVSYIEEKLQLVILARPDRPNGLQVAGATSGIGSFSAVAAASRGRTVVMFREPTFGFVSLVVLRGRSRSRPSRSRRARAATCPSTPAEGGRAAYWDPAGLGLVGARVPCARAPLTPPADHDLFPTVRRPRPLRSPCLRPHSPHMTSGRSGSPLWRFSCDSGGQPAAARATAWNPTAPLRDRPGGPRRVRLRGAYLAQLGIYGLPPNDLLPLDRAGVEAWSTPC